MKYRLLGNSGLRVSEISLDDDGRRPGKRLPRRAGHPHQERAPPGRGSRHPPHRHRQRGRAVLHHRSDGEAFPYQPENNRYFGFLVDEFADGIDALRELITAGHHYHLLAQGILDQKLPNASAHVPRRAQQDRRVWICHHRSLAGARCLKEIFTGCKPAKPVPLTADQ